MRAVLSILIIAVAGGGVLTLLPRTIADSFGKIRAALAGRGGLGR